MADGVKVQDFSILKVCRRLKDDGKCVRCGSKLREPVYFVVEESELEAYAASAKGKPVSDPHGVKVGHVVEARVEGNAVVASIAFERQLETVPGLEVFTSAQVDPVAKVVHQVAVLGGVAEAPAGVSPAEQAIVNGAIVQGAFPAVPLFESGPKLRALEESHGEVVRLRGLLGRVLDQALALNIAQGDIHRMLHENGGDSAMARRLSVHAEGWIKDVRGVEVALRNIVKESGK